MACVGTCRPHAMPMEVPQIDSNKILPQNDDVEGQNRQSQEIEDVHDYSNRAQWLRAAVLGANDGLLSTSSLMMGVGAVRQDARTMMVTGIAGMVAGACSMAIGEYVSVYSQYDIEVAQMERDGGGMDEDARRRKLPSPVKAAAASALAFAIGAVVPLLAAAFVKDYGVRLGVLVAAVSAALLGFGAAGAIIGKAPLLKSCLRVVLGGWLAMGITFGFTKLVGLTGI